MLALSPPRKKSREQDPEAPNTGASDFSVGSIFDSMNTPERHSILSPDDVAADDTAGSASGPVPLHNVNPWNVSIENEYLRQGDAWQDVPFADAVIQGGSAGFHISLTAESNSYEVVNGLIELSSPNSVNAPKRIEIFCNEFGPTKVDGKRWSRKDIAFKFKDMLGHGKKCLVHNLDIKSGTGWHCKGTGVVACGPCKVLKVLKQIGTNLHVEYQGGIPRMILDIATMLNLHNVDYRDLQLIFDSVTQLGHDITSCVELWAICLQDASGYLAANKRFYGCFMHPSLEHRPASDKPQHSASKGLADLWHETKIWKSGRYISFTNANRYRTGDKMEERSSYKKDVIDASTEHVKKNHSDWVQLTKNCWKELESVRNKLCKKSSGRKRTRYEEEEQESGLPGLPALVPWPANGPANGPANCPETSST